MLRAEHKFEMMLALRRGHKVDMMAGTKTIGNRAGTQAKVDMIVGTKTWTKGGHNCGHIGWGYKLDRMIGTQAVAQGGHNCWQ